MLNIAGALLGGLILSWFGFMGVVDVGMQEVFGKTITSTGYYFLFGLLGALRSVGNSFSINSIGRLNLNKNKDN